MYIGDNSLFLRRNSAHSYLFVASSPFQLYTLDLKPRLLCIGFFSEAGIPNFKILAPPLHHRANQGDSRSHARPKTDPRSKKNAQ